MAEALRFLGVARAGAGECAEAEAAIRRALRVDTALFGADSPQAAADLHALARAMKAEDTAEALEHLEQALELNRRNHGEESCRWSSPARSARPACR